MGEVGQHPSLVEHRKSVHTYRDKRGFALLLICGLCAAASKLGVSDGYDCICS